MPDKSVYILKIGQEDLLKEANLYYYKIEDYIVVAPKEIKGLNTINI